MIPVRYNLRSLFERGGTSVMSMLGLGMVAMIFVILFGFIGGLRSTMLNASADSNWVLLSKGAPSETGSFIPHDSIAIVRVRPEIAQDEGSHPARLIRDFRRREYQLRQACTPTRIDARRDADRVSSPSQYASGQWTLANSRTR